MFKVGDKIFYVNSDTGEKVYGTIMEISMCQILGRKRLWSFWNRRDRRGSLTFMYEDRCFLANKRAITHLPDFL